MKLFLNTAATLAVLFFVFGLMAQQKKKNNTVKAPAVTKPAHRLKPQLYLGQSGFCGGKIKVTMFDSLLHKGLSAKDSSGTHYAVVGFTLDYYERRMYADTADNTIFLVDYSSEYCPGDTISGNISGMLYNHIKPGDSVFFNNVSVARVNNNGKADTFLGTGMKCYLVK